MEIKLMNNFLIRHPYCTSRSIILRTDKSIEEVNKIIFLIQYIECDLPSIESEGEGIYQDDLNIILSEFFKLEIKEYSNQFIDYKIDILNNWELQGSISFKKFKEKLNLFKNLNKTEIDEFQNKFKKELYKIAYKNGLEIYLIDYRLNQIKNKNSKDFKTFMDIKNAVLNKDETFYWRGWCSKEEKINYKDYLNLK